MSQDYSNMILYQIIRLNKSLTKCNLMKLWFHHLKLQLKCLILTLGPHKVRKMYFNDKVLIDQILRQSYIKIVLINLALILIIFKLKSRKLRRIKADQLEFNQSLVNQLLDKSLKIIKRELTSIIMINNWSRRKKEEKSNL
jgi:hypothetical protein